MALNTNYVCYLHDFRLLPGCKCVLCCSVMLHNVDWWLVTDVLEYVSSISKGQAV
jgi:hypothetical protein